MDVILTILFSFFFIYFIISGKFLEITFSKDKSANYLKNLYYRKAKRHKFRVKLRIILLIVLPIANILLVPFYRFPYDSNEFDVLILLVSLLASITILIYILYNYFRKIKNFFDKSTYVEINNQTYLEIWKVCYQLIEKLNLSGLNLKIYYVKTNFIEAHIALEGKNIHLFLSRGLISHSSNSLKEIESILGHEFGHIYQGDSKLFLITKNAFELPILINNIQLFLSLISMIFGILSYGISTQTTPLITSLIITLLYRRLYTGVNRLRREAEFHADLSSLAFVENSQIAKIVEKYLPNIKSPNYPPKKERLESIEFISKMLNNMIKAEKLEVV